MKNTVMPRAMERRLNRVDIFLELQSKDLKAIERQYAWHKYHSKEEIVVQGDY
ncbi:MAG: hypothetical protein OEU36_12495 [Gammaproteobacteria bacterium]|nr:hypothetical protein [Gammaproteobacteria bacterium]